MHSLIPEYLAALRFDGTQAATLRTLGEYQGKQQLYSPSASPCAWCSVPPASRTAPSRSTWSRASSCCRHPPKWRAF